LAIAGLGLFPGFAVAVAGAVDGVGVGEESGFEALLF
jgi:hypothetical protein